MTQTLPIRTILENLSRFFAFPAGPPAAASMTGDELDEQAAREQLERRRYQEYLHWGFSPYSAW